MANFRSNISDASTGSVRGIGASPSPSKILHSLSSSMFPDFSINTQGLRSYTVHAKLCSSCKNSTAASSSLLFSSRRGVHVFYLARCLAGYVAAAVGLIHRGCF